MSYTTGATGIKHQNRLKLGEMKIEIKIEIEIASSGQYCRKDQDCLLSVNLLQELIATVFGGTLQHW